MRPFFHSKHYNWTEKIVVHSSQKCPNLYISLKIGDFVFVIFILPKFWPFCSFQTFYNQHKVQFCCVICSTILQSIYGFRVFQMENWSQNWPFCIVVIYCAQTLSHLQLSKLLQNIHALQSTFLVLFCLHKHFFQSSYWFTVLHMENWPQNCRFCIFDLNFAQILALSACLGAPTAHLWITKYRFSIVLFAQPVFQSSSGFTVFQMENWSQNWPFCTFDLNFTQILPFLHVWELIRHTYAFESTFMILFFLTTMFSVLWTSKCIFCFVLFAQLHFSAHFWIYSVSSGILASKLRFLF